MEFKISKFIPVGLKAWLFNNFRQRIGYRLTFNRRAADFPLPVASPYASIIAPNDPLTTLGEKFQPTKRLHNYLPLYWRHFRDIRFEVKRVMEIGVQTDKSIKMWEEFFPNATIYGVDIDPRCAEYAGGRIKIFIGSQDDERFLNTVIEDAGGSFDIVIDDGSHFVNHQLKSFDYLFPRLSSHGIYVIEDTGSCVRDYNLTTVGAVQSLVPHIFYPNKKTNHPHPGDMSEFPPDALWADRNIRGISFYRWICFIEKGNNPSDNPFLKR